MSYCSIEDAFQDPFQNRRKQRNNTPVIESFGCLNGANQLNTSDEYKYKHMLSRQHPEKVDLQVKLDKTTQQMRRPDEQSYYPDVSLESEYALITDVNHKNEGGYRPPHPFTLQSQIPPQPNQSQPQQNDIMVNDNMYESFNQSDNLMTLDTNNQISNHNNNYDNTPQDILIGGITPKNNSIVKQSVNVQDDKLEVIQKLVESHKQLEMKLDEVLNKLNKIEQSDGKENIHDIILFGIFGLFFIYILDSVYKIGKKST